MNTFLIVVLTVLLIALAYCFMMLIRNEWVFKQRQKVLREDSEQAHKIIHSGHPPKSINDFHPRYNALPSYETMMQKFWIWDVNKFLK